MRAAASERSLDFDVGLLRVGVLQVLVHRRDRHEGGRGQAVGQDVRKHRGAGLRRQNAGHLRLAELRDVGRVPRRQQGVGHGAQRHPIEEDAGPAAHEEVLRRRRRPDEARTRRHVVGVGVDRLEELQVVAKADVERQPRAGAPLVLGVDAEIRVRLVRPRDRRTSARIRCSCRSGSWPATRTCSCRGTCAGR